MFPRYLFVHLHSVDQDWAPIRSTRGAIGLVRYGEHAVVVPDTVIETLRKRADQTDTIDLKPNQQFVENEELELLDGPCAGYRALFVARRGADRVIVLLNLMDQQRRIEMPAASVQPLRWRDV